MVFPLGVIQQNDLRIGMYYRRARTSWARSAGATRRVVMLLAYRYRHATFSKAKLCCRISLSDDGKGVCSVETDAAYSGLDLEKNSWHLQKALIRSNTTGLRAGFEISNTPSCSWAHDTISIWTSGPFFLFSFHLPLLFFLVLSSLLFHFLFLVSWFVQPLFRSLHFSSSRSVV